MGYQYYNYDPSFAAAAIFVILFAASTLLHIFQLVRKRTWYFIPFVIGGIFEAIGYAGRALSAKETPDWTLMPYIMQSILLLLGPTFFAASIYMILGRLIRLTNGEAHSIVRATLVTKIFLVGDIMSFFAQSAGGGMLAKAKSQDDQKNGERIIIIGLLIQIAFFGFFIVVSALFHYRIALYPTARSRKVQVPWRRYLWILYIASGLIMVRSIYRLLEYVQGKEGVLQSKEAYIYVLDAALMFVVAAIFNAFHPSQIINKESMSTEVYDVGADDTEYMVGNRNRGQYENVHLGV